ncbi:MAG TPA: methionine synthase, partial [Phycisphaerae bacterium]|nr:methionine synthase [Phycisphaerae bacterium]
MGILLDALATRKILISDGAWGTMLQGMGMTCDDCPEEWNVSHADEVKSVAKAYADAGSDLILTDTFGGTSCKLKKMGYGDKVKEFNAAGATNSLEAAPSAIIAGSVGPTGEFLEPYGDMTAAEMEAVFTEQISAMLEAGLKVICVETMTAIEEAACAIKASKKLDPSVDVICTMTFDATSNGFRTMMGVDPARAAKELVEAGADVIGSNCGNGIENMIGIAAELRANTAVPILIHANAGMPVLKDGETVFEQTPEDMAAKVKEVVDAGANL